MPEIIGTSGGIPVEDLRTAPGSTSGVGTEIEISVARRAFPVTQELFAGSPVAPALELVCGWHDTAANLETGAFGLVQDGAGLDDLIGEIVRVTNAGREVYVYVLQSASIPTQFSLYRRAWLAIARLSIEDLTCEVVPVG